MQLSGIIQPVLLRANAQLFGASASSLNLSSVPLIQGYDTKFCFYIYFRSNPQFALSLQSVLGNN